MSYEPQAWADGPAGGTPVSAARLQHMEAGIEAAANGPIGDERLPARLSETELDAAFGSAPEVADRFDFKANGAPGTALRGGAWSLHGGSVGNTAKPTVVGGKLSKAAGLNVPAAGYATLPLPRPMQRIGGKFTLSPYTTANGSAVLIGWGQDVAVTFPAIPDSPCHLAITATGWVYGVWTGGGFTQVTSGTFGTPLAADNTTEHAVEVIIDRANAKAHLVLPDKSVTTVSHALIGSVAANFAGWEFYQQATTDSLAAFSQVWADSTMPVDRLPIVRALTAHPAPTVVQYAPTNNYLAVPTSMADVDVTNLSATFTLPPGYTAAKVEIDAYVDMTSATRILWAYREGGTTFGTRSMINGQYKGSLHYEHKRTGMAAGSTHTITWQHLALAGGQVLNLDNPNGYYAVITVTPLPA